MQSVVFGQSKASFSRTPGERKMVLGATIAVSGAIVLSQFLLLLLPTSVNPFWFGSATGIATFFAVLVNLRQFGRRGKGGVFDAALGAVLLTLCMVVFTALLSLPVTLPVF